MNILQLVDRRRSVGTRILASLQSLFRTLLHQRMTAQIRVRDLDLTVLEPGEPNSSAGAAESCTC